MDFSNIKGKIKYEYPLAHLTWFKVGGAADIYYKPEDLEDLIAFLKINNNTYPITVLGAGSNTIIRDGGIEGVVIKLARNFTDITFDSNNNLVVGGGCLNYSLARFAEKSSITGLEFLIGIPGCIGGGIAMNAGSYGSEFKDIVISVEAIDFSGNKHVFIVDEIGFGYRKNSLPKNLIFTSVTFKASKGVQSEISAKMKEIAQKREDSQPIREMTGGSTFANPEGHRAWELIDAAGLRGNRMGDAGISEKHCNFMINHGQASARELEELGDYVRAKVKQNSGVELKWEIKRIGRSAASK